MESWGWIVAYLVGFTLFQLLLFRYFSDGRTFGGMSLGSNEASAPGSVEQGQPVHESNGRLPSDDVEVDDDGDARAANGETTDDGVHCHRCGAFNADEAMFRYCRECLTQLR